MLALWLRLGLGPGDHLGFLVIFFVVVRGMAVYVEVARLELPRLFGVWFQDRQTVLLKDSFEERKHRVLCARNDLVHLRGGETGAIRQVLRRLKPDAGRHGRVADETFDHLNGFVGAQEHPLGGTPAHLRSQAAMDLADDRAIYGFPTAPLARLQRAVAPDHRVR